jgi:hypothetical protein
VRPVDAIPYPGERPPAPGRLRLVQRFVNTVDYEHGREVLHSPARLRALLVELGLLEARAQVGEDDLRRAHALREDLRALALANNGVRTGVELETAVADGTWPRLKACRRDVCGWLFFDRSRNRSARWCQMAVCGNRTKTRAYRARRR